MVLQMAREKLKAREEFKRMMEEEERKKVSITRNGGDDELPGRSTDGPKTTKTVGFDDVDAGFGTTVSAVINFSKCLLK